MDHNSVTTGKDDKDSTPISVEDNINNNISEASTDKVEKISSKDVEKEDTLSKRKTFKSIDRIIFTSLFAILTILGIFLPAGISASIVLFFGSVAIAGAISPNVKNSLKLSVFFCVPLSLIVMISYIIFVGTVANFMNISVWQQPWQAKLTLIMLMVGTIITSFFRKDKIFLFRKELAGLFTFLASFGIGVILVTVKPIEIWGSKVAQTTDFNRHLIMMKDVIMSGMLDQQDNTGYPVAVHTLIGTVWRATGGHSFIQGWAALESSMWLLFSFMLAALAYGVTHLARTIGFPTWAGQIVLPILLFYGVLQSMWIITFAYGFLTSIAAGLILAIIFQIGSVNKWIGSISSIIVSILCTFVLLETWTILAIIPMFLVLYSLIVWLISKPAYKKIIFVVLFLSSIIIILLPFLSSIIANRSGDGNIGSALNVFGMSGLARPQWWWSIFLVFTILTIVLLFFKKRKLSSIWFTILVTTNILVVIGLGILTKTSLTIMNYYMLKTLWIGSSIVMALGLLGIVWIFVILYRFVLERKNNLLRFGGFTILSAIIMIVFALIGGQIKGDGGSNTYIRFTTSNNYAVPTLPAIDALEKMNIHPKDKQNILVWGIMPYATTSNLVYYNVAQRDRAVIEGSSWLGFDGGFRTDEGLEVYNPIVLSPFNSTIACDMLRKEPNMVRVSGPNKATGAQWLIESGCPIEIVKPDEWIHVAIPDAWFEGTPEYQKPFFYPTYQEYLIEKEKKEIMQKKIIEAEKAVKDAAEKNK